MTYTEGRGTTDQPEPEKRDFDQERSAAALKFDVPDEKLNPATKPKPVADENHPDAEMTPDLEAFLLSAALCNLATVRHELEAPADQPEWQVTGEPTEIALQVFAHRFGRGKKSIEAVSPALPIRLPHWSPRQWRRRCLRRCDTSRCSR